MNIVTFAFKTATHLMKIGAWGTLSNYANQQFRDSSNGFNREVERIVEHEAIKLRVIKND